MWVDGTGSAMLKVKNQFHLNRNYKLYNDKLYGNTLGATNPYTAFLKAGTGAKPDKWNPADIWVMNRSGLSALIKMNRKVMSRRKVSLSYANQFLMNEFSLNFYCWQLLGKIPSIPKTNYKGPIMDSNRWKWGFVFRSDNF